MISTCRVHFIYFLVDCFNILFSFVVSLYVPYCIADFFKELSTNSLVIFFLK